MSDGKYAKYVTELVMKDGEDLPKDHFHYGKITNALEFDRRYFDEAEHHIETFIIYKPGAGFGHEGSSLGIIEGKEFKDLPLKVPAIEMSLFIGTNPEDPTDLGGEAECWFGEGEDAEKYIITKTSCVFFPPGLVHLPIYFRKVERPFVYVVIVCASELNAESVDSVPPGFRAG